MTELTHRVARMTGRDPEEKHRVATPLELLFDLTFVVAFGAAGNELAHAVALGHVGGGLMGFAFASFAIAWAWIQFSWFASSYDTDDWVYRLTTMLQMAGVLIFALGIPQMFYSIEHYTYLDNTVMVMGYVVMRVAMVFQWARAARQDPARAPVARIYIISIVVSQIGWVIQAFSHTSFAVTAVWAAGLLLIELGAPVVAESKVNRPRWHAHHIAERYGLLVIIALGEGMIGTMAAMTGVFTEDGWSVEFVLILVAGVSVTFGMWWTYFVIPFGELLHHLRERRFGWGYGHIFTFASVVGVGAGLHVVGYYLEHEAGSDELDFALGTTGTILAVAVPLAVFLIGLFVMYGAFTRTWDPFHGVLIAITAGVLILGVVLAATGAGLAWGLLVLSLSPWVTVVGYELRGHRHNEAVLADLEHTSPDSH